jgi:hypothetical protein
MKADILKLLLQSHAEGDESSFRKAALQLAATASATRSSPGSSSRRRSWPPRWGSAARETRG